MPGGAKLRREIFEAKRGYEVVEKVDAFFAARDTATGFVSTEPETVNSSLDTAPAWMG